MFHLYFVQYLEVSLTKKATKALVKATRPNLFHPGMKGSGNLVTGLILRVWTSASNSGLVCSSWSSISRSHSQASTACLRFQSSTKSVAAAELLEWISREREGRTHPRHSSRRQRPPWCRYQTDRRRCRDRRTRSAFWSRSTWGTPGTSTSHPLSDCDTPHPCQL